MLPQTCPKTGLTCTQCTVPCLQPNLYPLTQPVRYGWICPRCNQVKSPDVATCYCHTSLGNAMAQGQ